MFLNANEPWTDRSEDVHLQMVGVCLENAVGSGLGPRLKYADDEDLKGVKISHSEVRTALQSLMDLRGVRETFIWNTCNRFEVYFFHTGNRDELIADVLGNFFSSLADRPEKVNRLSDDDAIHHLIRTAVGFNSGLPGEKDVAMQLHSAVRHSEVVGSAGPLTQALTERVFDCAREIREETVWKKFSPSYCDAALEEALRDACPGDVHSENVAVIGSSNTSRSCIEILRTRFGISEENVTVYHRCHHKDGQMKAMKRASRGSLRVRVSDYDDDSVHQGIADSRLVIIGIDRNHPVISGEKLKPLLKGQEEVILIDFNTFGSCEGLEDLEGIQVIEAKKIEENVREYAARMARNSEFQAALNTIEPLVQDQVRSLRPIQEDEEEEAGVAGQTFAMGAI